MIPMRNPDPNMPLLNHADLKAIGETPLAASREALEALKNVVSDTTLVWRAEMATERALGQIRNAWHSGKMPADVQRSILSELQHAQGYIMQLRQPKAAGPAPL